MRLLLFTNFGTGGGRIRDCKSDKNERLRAHNEAYLTNTYLESNATNAYLGELKKRCVAQNDCKFAFKKAISFSCHRIKDKAINGLTPPAISLRKQHEVSDRERTRT